MHSSTCIQVIKCITFVTVEAYVPVRNLFTFSLIVIVNWNAKKAHFETNDDFIKDYRLHSISHRFHCGLHCSPLLLNSSSSPTPAPPPPPPTPLIPAATLHMNRNTTEKYGKREDVNFWKKKKHLKRLRQVLQWHSNNDVAMATSLLKSKRMNSTLITIDFQMFIW